MLKKIRLLIITISLFFSIKAQHCYSQTGTLNPASLMKPLAASPDVSSLGKFGTYPVTLNHGLVDISIPIFTLKCGDLDVPVSLSYHGSGIRLNDIATNVGLGWTLNTGGILTMQVNGRPDQYRLGVNLVYKSTRELDSMYAASISNFSAFMMNYSSEQGNSPYSGGDGQSDVYSYTYPGGGGSFMYDLKNKRYFPIGNPLLKIESDAVGSLNFILTDEYGNCYYYRYAETTVGDPGGDNQQNGCLYKIVSANKIDSVLFQYVEGEDIYEHDYSQSYSTNYCTGPYSAGFPCENQRNAVIYYHTTILSGISTRDTKVDFLIANDRLDRRKQRYTGIRVTDLNTNNIVKEVALKHSYFLGDNQSPNPNNARLRLDTVKFIDKTNHNDQNYILRYNDLQLPDYFSFYDAATGIASALNKPNLEQDYCGFWNGKVTNTSLLPTGLDLPAGIPTGDRNSDETHMKACMLKAIIYPTGGITKFDFEPNKVFNNFWTGLRIRSIMNYDPYSKLVNYRLFKYGSNEDGYGRHTSLDKFSVNQLYSYIQRCIFAVTGPNGVGSAARLVNYYNSNPNGSLMGVNGTPVFYTNVTEYLGDAVQNTGKIMYKYDFVADENKGVPATIPWGLLSYDTYKNQFLFFDRSSSRGQLLDVAQYENKNSSYVLKKHTVNSYDTFNVQKKYVGIFIDNRNYYVDISGNAGGTDLWRCYYYSDLNEETGSKLLVKTVDSTFENSSTLVNTTTYSYNNLNHLRPSVIKTGNSKGEDVIIKYAYTADFPGLTANDDYTKSINWLLQNNIKVLPVEESRFVNKNGSLNLTSSFFRKYKPLTIYPDKIYRIENAGTLTDFASLTTQSGALRADSRYNEYLSFDSYSRYGKIQEQHKTNDVQETYLWAYKGQYPVAKVVGAGLASFSQQVDINLLQETSSEAVIQQQLNSLRQVFSNSPVLVHSYLYSPLIGIKQETSPSNHSAYYSYDALNRLTTIKDDNGKILKQIEYSYQPGALSSGTPDWQVTGNVRCVQNGHKQNTGVQEIEKKDMNFLSDTYGQTNWYTNINNISACPLPAVFYSFEKRQSFIRNNCGSGYKGSAVVYVVRDSAYSSTISQENADQKAQNDIDANGQSYANANGTCIADLPPCGISAAAGFTVYAQDFTQSGNTVTVPQFTVIINTPPGNGTINFKIGTVYGQCAKNISKNFAFNGKNWVLTINGTNVYLSCDIANLSTGTTITVPTFSYTL